MYFLCNYTVLLHSWVNGYFGIVFARMLQFSSGEGIVFRGVKNASCVLGVTVHRVMNGFYVFQNIICNKELIK